MLLFQQEKLFNEQVQLFVLNALSFHQSLGEVRRGYFVIPGQSSVLKGLAGNPSTLYKFTSSGLFAHP